MEDLKIKQFLSSNFGSGDGYGDGSGDGYGIKSLNGESIRAIDGVLTIIRAVHGDFAKGAILRKDMSLVPCFVAKQNGKFAHGETLHKAREALLSKLFDDMPVEERVEAFVEAHDTEEPYPNSDFFEWHHRLTGSCEMGRREFALAHGIDVEHGSMTVAEFIGLTENDYGGGTIRKLRRYYECTS